VASSSTTVPAVSAHIKQEEEATPRGGGAPDHPVGEAAGPSSKKARKSPSHEGGGATMAAAPTPPSAATAAAATTITATAFDDMTDVELLGLLSRTVAERGDGTWDHECQRLGSALAVRACRAAASSAYVRGIARDSGAVTARDILDWIGGVVVDDDGGGGGPRSIFVEYERTMLRKIERKSFMMSMGKALARAGYTKNELLSGRALRWNLPGDRCGGGGGGGGVGVKREDGSGGGGGSAPGSFSFNDDNGGRSTAGG
jgi:hypothetical protein